MSQETSKASSQETLESFEESYHSCNEEKPTEQAATTTKASELVDAEEEAEVLHIYDYYADVEGNLYHKNDLTGKLIKEMKLVDAKYLFEKYALKLSTAETNVPFTQAEDELLMKAATMMNNDFEAIKNRLFRYSIKTTEQIRNRFYILTEN